MVDRFKNTWLWSHEHQQAVQLINTQQVADTFFYRVWIPGKNSVSLAPSTQFLPIENSEALTKEEIIYRTAAGKVGEILSQDMFVSPVSSNLIPLPHQIHALTRIFQKEKIRYLLADEVGLGKTIEAGMVIKELKLRKKISRVLILAPKGLVKQWIEELRLRFNEDFKLIVPESAERITSDNGNIWNLFDQVVVPLDSVKPLRYRSGWTPQKIEEYNQKRFKDLILAKWDLIVIDEAHKLAGTSSQVARYRLGKGLARASTYLLLLSATPHQGKTDAFLRLMSILDNHIFHEGMEISHELVEKYVIRTEKRNAIDLQGRPLFKKRHTATIAIRWEEDHALQRELYQQITDYVRTGYNQARLENRNYIGFLMVLMQRLVSSSTRAIRTALEKRQSVLSGALLEEKTSPQVDEDWWDLEPEERLSMLLSSAPQTYREEIEKVNNLLALACRCEAVRPDAKAERLNELILTLRAQENNPDLKFLVFTEFVTTQEMLREFLTAHGFSVVCLNGSMSLEERRSAQQHFADTAHVLVSTEAGGEGLNLQFCHIVFNYDIPWNPMRIEQRIGRVDRIGQRHDVNVINFLFAGTVEERVHQILMEKLMVILQDLGFDKISDVLDSSEAERGFEDLYLHAILEPETVEERMNQFIANFIERTREEKTSLALLESDQHLDVQKAQEFSQSLLPFWLEIMVINFLKCHGGKSVRNIYGYNLLWPDGYAQNNVTFSKDTPEYSLLRLVSLSDPRIEQIFSELPHAHPDQPQPHIVIPSLSAEIKGKWSLWRFNILTQDREIVQFLPFFVSNEGKLLLTTAKNIWESLGRGEFTFVGNKIEQSNYLEPIYGEVRRRSEDMITNNNNRQSVTTIDFFPVLFIEVEGSDGRLA